jgi:hypothetical protein
MRVGRSHVYRTEDIIAFAQSLSTSGEDFKVPRRAIKAKRVA